ncbi:MAG: BrnT family toxin [Candidatus Omnitrophota bacterium]
MRIKNFEWDYNNIRHIRRHDVMPTEVAEVVFDGPIYLRTRDERYIVFGITKNGRYLFVAFKKIGTDKMRVITARDMTKKEKQYYKKRRG